MSQGSRDSREGIILLQDSKTYSTSASGGRALVVEFEVVPSQRGCAGGALMS